MRIFNPELFGNIILPGLLSSTIWSALVALVVGTLVGLLIGAIKRKSRQTVLPAIAGCFFGTMLLCLLPIYSVPGIVGGGGYGGIVIMLIISFTLPVGALGGAIAGSIVGLKLFKEQQKKIALSLLIGTYLIMALIIFTSASWHCSQPNTLFDYCTRAGYSN